MQASTAVLPTLANTAAWSVAPAMPTWGSSHAAQPAVGTKPLAYTGELPAAPAMPAQVTSTRSLAYTGGLSAAQAAQAMPPGVVHSGGVVAPLQAGGPMPVPALAVAPVPGAAVGGVPTHALAVRPQAMAVHPHALAVPPQALAVPPQALAVPPQALAVPTQALVVPPQGSFALQSPAAALAALALHPNPTRSVAAPTQPALSAATPFVGAAPAPDLAAQNMALASSVRLSAGALRRGHTDSTLERMSGRSQLALHEGDISLAAGGKLASC